LARLLLHCDKQFQKTNCMTERRASNYWGTRLYPIKIQDWRSSDWEPHEFWGRWKFRSNACEIEKFSKLRSYHSW
jgi:hypothetical protein